MASITLDLPAPVGPVRANRSAPSKSTTVRLPEGGEALELEALRPHPRPPGRSARRAARRRASAGGRRRRLALGQVLGEQLVGRAAQAHGPGRHRPRPRPGGPTPARRRWAAAPAPPRPDPARAGSSTATRRKASPTSLASARARRRSPAPCAAAATGGRGDGPHRRAAGRLGLDDEDGLAVGRLAEVERPAASRRTRRGSRPRHLLGAVEVAEGDVAERRGEAPRRHARSRRSSGPRARRRPACRRVTMAWAASRFTASAAVEARGQAGR